MNSNSTGMGKIAVAMSGGVDSSVAALLLKRQGFDVVGLFMSSGLEDPGMKGACCSAADSADARFCAARIGMPFYAVNCSKAFADLAGEFASSYLAGRTPNPCVRCNSKIKFGYLLDFAASLGARILATGHYARIARTPRGPRIARGLDAEKDQSYFLFELSPGILDRALFPAGDLTKEKVRLIASEAGLPVKDKPESQDVCFALKGGYAAFVEENSAGPPPPGEIAGLDGKVLGRHEGIHRYTVGQRRGLRIGGPCPLYVVRIDPSENRVIVGREEDLMVDGFKTTETVIHPGIPENGLLRAAVQVRYRQAPVPCTIGMSDGNTAFVKLDRPVRGVAPGQAAVFYAGDRVEGGGWIDSTVLGHV